MKTIEEVLSAIKGIGSMYVEPGDVIVVQYDEKTTEEEVLRLQKVLKHVFNNNAGLFISENIEFKIIKKGESDGSKNEEIEGLKKEIEQLKAQLIFLAHKISF